jgi:hypothetical protein
VKTVLAAVEAAFCVVATYVVVGLVLFVSSSNSSVPGFMSAVTTTGEGTTSTSLEFEAVGGLVLLVVLTVLFRAFHHRSAKPRGGQAVGVGN